MGGQICAEAPVTQGSFLVIDQDYILFECQAAQKARAFIESQRLSFQSEIDQQEKRLRQEESFLEKEQQSLSEESFMLKRQDFEKKVNEIHKKVALRRSQLEKAFNKARETIVVQMKDIIGKIAASRKVSLILPKGVVLYFDPALDATEEVLTQLNGILPEVNVLKEIENRD